MVLLGGFMREKKSSLGTILASVFITLIISGVGMYFGMPLLYPNVNADLTEYTDENTGNLLQTEYLEVNTIDYINDFDLNYTVVPGMEMNITTHGNSRLIVFFEGLLFLMMDSDFTGFTGYNVSLAVSGIGNSTTLISYYISSNLASFVYQSHNIHLTFDTGIIAAGGYSISVFWKSVSDNPISITSLTTEVLSNYHCPRKIYVQEFSVL